MWYHNDNYYFKHIGKIEINIKALNDTDISIWIYDHGTNKELENSICRDVEHVQEMLLQHIGSSIRIPSHHQLIKLI